MTSLSARRVSLSDHVKRRRSSTALSSSSGSDPKGSRGSLVSSRDGSSGSSSSGGGSRRGRPQHHPAADPNEGGYDSPGYDSHAASYGNYDAPSAHCRSYGASEVGCYGAERYIGGGGGCAHSPVAPRRGTFPDPEVDVDLEGQRREEVRPRSRRTGRGRGRDEIMDPAWRVSQAAIPATHGGHPSWEENGCAYYPRGPESRCPSASTASTASSSLDSSGSSRSEDEALRQGILDLSALIATYIAGALSFVVGIFLALLSPFVRVIKIILGDVRGLLGDAGIFRELGSLWRMYRALRRRSAASQAAEGRGRDDCQSRSHCDDYESHDGISNYGGTHVQYVGGWRPSAPSVGSAGTGGSSWSPYRPVANARPQNARSHPSLPLVHEEGRYPGHERHRASSPTKVQVPHHRQADPYYGRPAQPPQEYHRQAPPSMPRYGSAQYEQAYHPQASSHRPSPRRSRSGVV